jgi:hypothetical protein
MERLGNTVVSAETIGSESYWEKAAGASWKALSGSACLFAAFCNFWPRMVRCGAARNVRSQPVVLLHLSRQPPVEPTIGCRIGARLVPLIGSRTYPILLILSNV